MSDLLLGSSLADRGKRRGCAVVLMLLVGSCLCRGETVPALMPMPAHMEQRGGQMVVDDSFDVTIEGFSEPRLERARLRFLERVTQLTGVPLISAAPGKHARLVLHAGGPSKPVQELGEDESYRLEVSGDHATLTAPNPLGVMHGLQTFLQLLHATPEGFAVPGVVIEDQPRFPWRGLMLDASRHFMPLPQVRETLDGMEAVKMNVFHWHLSDNQGFRMESKQFPLLQDKGSDGLYYTQDQVREVLAYARDRGIRVIAEFDMPGHTTAWFVGYPQLSAGPGPYEIERRWGVFDPAMDPSREETYAFLDKFLGEATALFPDAYFHVGGDECNGKQWDANPKIQQFMREHGLKDNAALQAYFTARVQKLVAKHGKQMVGWDEVLQPDTPHEVVIQSWRGPESLAEAARRGYRGILSAGYYLDLNQPASEHYLADPMDAASGSTKKGEGGTASALTPDQARNILGGEAAEWSEFISPEILENRLWPRAAAVAERLWSPREVRDVPSMYARLGLVSRELAMIGIPNGAAKIDMLTRMSGQADPKALAVLATAVQPPRDYNREGLRLYTQFSPLNHMADAVPAESEPARIFAGLAARIHAGQATEAERAEARRWMEMWAGNDAVLAPTLGVSDLTAELRETSRNVSRAAAIGLAALDRKGAADAAAITELKAMEELRPDSLRNMLAPAVLVLIGGQ